MSQYLPPMSGGQDGRIIPGPIQGGACPSPREIVVIEVPKVFDFCFQEDLLERLFTVTGLPATATVMNCEIVDVTCMEVLDREPIPDSDGLALVSVQINLTVRITISPAPGATPIVEMRNIAFPKRVVLCAPTGSEVRCDVRGTCICTVQPTVTNGEPNVCCTIQLCTTIKSVADVNILVPTFGVVVPQECRVSAVFGGCPPLPPDVCNTEFRVAPIRDRRDRRDRDRDKDCDC